MFCHRIEVYVHAGCSGEFTGDDRDIFTTLL